jgi:hypothetical protein
MRIHFRPPQHRDGSPRAHAAFRVVAGFDQTVVAALAPIGVSCIQTNRLDSLHRRRGATRGEARTPSASEMLRMDA